jgi:hypothetical protein
MVIDPALRVPPSQPTEAGPSVVSVPALGATILLNTQVLAPAVTHTPSQVPASAVVAHTPSQVPTPAIAHAPSQGRSNKGKDWALPPSEVDMHANPHYPSQLPPVFTQCYAKQEQQLKAMEHEAAEQRDVEHQMKNTVEVYGWSKVCFLRYDFTLCILTAALGWCRGDYV